MAIPNDVISCALSQTSFAPRLNAQGQPCRLMCAGYTSSSKQIAFDDYTSSTIVNNPDSDSRETSLCWKSRTSSCVLQSTLVCIAQLTRTHGRRCPLSVGKMSYVNLYFWPVTLSLSGRYKSFDAQLAVILPTPDT
jgi:hypothetical protein